MAFINIFKREKKEREASRSAADSSKRKIKEHMPESPKAEKESKKEETSKIKTSGPKNKSAEIKAKQSVLAAEFLLNPHITEQSAAVAEKNVYTFKVKPSANKTILKKAIKEMYGFEPVKIRIINVPSKKRIVRGKTGTKSGFKKALVYLKEGDKIEFI